VETYGFKSVAYNNLNKFTFQIIFSSFVLAITWRSPSFKSTSQNRYHSSVY